MEQPPALVWSTCGAWTQEHKRTVSRMAMLQLAEVKPQFQVEYRMFSRFKYIFFFCGFDVIDLGKAKSYIEGI